MSILSDELTLDPLGRGYAGMTDAEAATSLNTVDRTRNRTNMTGDEVFQATSATDFNALTDAQKSQWLAFCARSSIDPFGSANVAFVQNILPNATVTALQALRVENISRAEELGVGQATILKVATARAL